MHRARRSSSPLAPGWSSRDGRRASREWRSGELAAWSFRRISPTAIVAWRTHPASTSCPRTRRSSSSSNLYPTRAPRRRVHCCTGYAFLALFIVVPLISTASHQASPTSTLLLAFVGVFLAWPLLLTPLGRTIASGDRRFLTGFLVEELELTRPPSVETQFR